MKTKLIVLSVSTLLLFSGCSQVTQEPKTKVIYIKSKCPKKPKFHIKKETFEPMEIDYEVK